MTADEIKQIVNSPYYYDRYDKNKHWDYVSVLSGRPMQSAEFNEIQHIAEEKIKSLGEALYEHGTIIDGCELSFNSSTKKATLKAGRIFLDGIVYAVEAKTLTINNINVQIGIWKISSVLTEYSDNSLQDPAKNTPQYKMPGAYRVITQAQWGINTEAHEHSSFCPLYTIDENNSIKRLTNGKATYLSMLARYDKHAHGNYVVEGIEAKALTNSNDVQTFSVSKGLSHINGYEVELNRSTTFTVNAMPDLAEVKDEPYSFMGDSSGKMKINVACTPVESVSRVRVTKERTVTLTHGSETNCTDVLPDDTVFEILEIKQGALVFVENTDFILSNDGLDWSLSGEEPTPGTKYSVKYHYRTNIQPDTFDENSITVSGLFENSLIEVSYFYKMPRKDIIVMYEDCSIGIIRGMSKQENPILPDIPEGAIAIAEVIQTWNGLPIVNNFKIKSVHVDTLVEILNKMQTQIDELYKRLGGE